MWIVNYHIDDKEFSTGFDHKLDAVHFAEVNKLVDYRILGPDK